MKEYFHIDNGGYHFTYEKTGVDQYSLFITYDYMGNESTICMNEFTPIMLQLLGEAMIREAGRLGQN